MNGCEKQPWRLSFAMALAGLVLVLGAGVAAGAGGQGTRAFVPGEHVRLTDTNTYDIYPMVSPDGRWVVFHGQQSTPPYAADIYKLSLEDLSVTRLTFDGRSHTPSFSRDGASIFYSSALPEQYRNIWKMKSDGTDQRPLSPPVIPQAMPNELPDGRIVYHWWFQDWDWGISIMDADGTGQTTLPGVVAGAQQPRVSPDGRYVTYSSLGPNRTWDDVYIYDLETFTETRLTYESAEQGYPNFSPDGNWIVYGSNEDGGSSLDLWIMDTSGGNRQQLTFEDARQRYPAFLPDGSGIVYTSSEGGLIPDLWLLRLVSAVDVAVDIKPDTLNPRSRGRYVTACIELAERYDVADIGVGSVYLAVEGNETLVPAEPGPVAIGDYDSDGVPDLMVKFDRSAVEALLIPGETATVYVGGLLADGTEFLGSDTVRVLGMVNSSVPTFLAQVAQANQAACQTAQALFDALTSSRRGRGTSGGARRVLRLLDALLRRSPDAGLSAGLTAMQQAVRDLAQSGANPTVHRDLAEVYLYDQSQHIANSLAVLADCYDFERGAWLRIRRGSSSDFDLTTAYEALDVVEAQIALLSEAINDFRTLAGALSDPQRAQQLTALADETETLLLGFADYAAAERTYVDSW